MSKSTDNLSSTCPLCYQNIKIYAIGPCDHIICHVCSTRMRVVCKQMYCPVCRADLPQVVFMEKQHLYSGIITHRFPRDRETHIFFQNNRIRLEYYKLLSHGCQLCPDRAPDKTFKALQDHMRKEHELFYCDLCVEHLQIFTSERKSYPRRELAMHRRKGDADDKSYRGHPLCEFCDKRYFDKDELLRHLRRDHYFCHFCESTGISNQFYSDYDNLREHFRAEHFLCEEGDCRYQEFSHAFSSDIDFKAHIAAVHSRSMSKFQARQNRQIDVEINLPPRYRERDRRGGHSVGRGRAHLLREEHEETHRAVQASLQTAREEEELKRRKHDEKTKTKIVSAEEFAAAAGGNNNVRRRDDEEVQERTRKPQSKKEKDGPKKDAKEDITPKNVISNEKEFPKLSEQEKDNPPLVTSWGKTKVESSDFPELNPSGGSTKVQTSATWVPQKMASLNEYPVLGGGGNSSAQAINRETWSKMSNVTDTNSIQSKGNLTKVASNPAKKPLTETVPVSNSDVQSTPEEFPSLSSIATFLKGPSTSSKPAERVSAHNLSESKKLKNKKDSRPNKTQVKQTDIQSKSKTETSSHSAVHERLEEKPVCRPPPGFGIPAHQSAKVSIPPGFHSIPANTLENNMASQSSFFQTQDYKDRNRELVQRIRRYLKEKEDGFNQFRTLSGLFRTGVIDGQNYYDQCLSLLGDNFRKIFSELVSLLPDVEKQQELLRVHNDKKALQSHGDTAVLNISNKNKQTAWKAGDEVRHSICSQCRQLIPSKDLEEHLNTHQDFPALVSTVPTRTKAGVPRQSAWGRLK